MRAVQNNPDAGRLIHGLRDTGYDFQTAAADIIDNSIAANATQISVELSITREGRKFVFFGDNGDGMDPDQLKSAMRYGAPVRANLSSLGKFGLGLKTASSSVCKRFSVISRKSSNEQLMKLTWDLDHVAQVQEWEMLEEDISDEEREEFAKHCGGSGTLIIWSNCDRMLQKEYEAGSTNEQRAVQRLKEKLKEHIALTYYRFLDEADDRAENVKIIVNGEEVVHWNPFYPAKSEQMLSQNQQTLELELEDGTESVIKMKAWILPHSKDMGKDENKKFAKIANHRQGFYIHRENRVIQSGGWLQVFGDVEPHTSLLRIEFDFEHTADEAFKIDVKKSRILFDPALEAAFKQILQPFYREANRRSRGRSSQSNANSTINHKSSNTNISNTQNTAKPDVESASSETNTVTLRNNHGGGITLKQTVQDNASNDLLYVEAVDTITSGNLWEPAMRKTEQSDGHKPAVLINKFHEFYKKIYQRSKNDRYAIEGLDLLLWSLAVAEDNSTNEEIAATFEDFREEVSSNLKRLLRDFPELSDDELESDDNIA